VSRGWIMRRRRYHLLLIMDRSGNLDEEKKNRHREPALTGLGVGLEVEEGEGLEGGVAVVGARVLGGQHRLAVLEQRAVEVLAREGRDLGVHPVLPTSGRCQPLGVMASS
jgi:hypothetical protein